MRNDTRTLAKGAGLGAGITVCAVFLGPPLLASGTTTVLSVVALGLATATVLVQGDLRSDGLLGRMLSRRSKVAVIPAAPFGSQGETPEDWLAAHCGTQVPETDVQEYLRTRLHRDLTPWSGWTSVAGDRKALGLLAMAFAARATPSEEDWAAEVLELLRKAYRSESGSSRSEALAATRALVAAKAGTEVNATYSAAVAAHGMRETLFMGLLQAARRRGVLASGEFTWLKAVDRSLWYALSNLGRPTFHVEGLAAVDHFRAEIAAGRALHVPSVDGAVEALSRIREGAGTGGVGKAAAA